MSRRLTFHHYIYFILLTLLCASQAVSNWMMSGMEILLVVNMLLEWDMRERWQRAKKEPLLLAVLVFFAVHLLWLIVSDNLSYGLHDIFSKLPLLAIPLVVLTSRKLSSKQLSFILFFYVGTVIVACCMGWIRHFRFPDLAYRDYFPYISHIRFSLNVCMAIIFLALFLLRVFQYRQWGRGVVALLFTLFLISYLLLVNSYTGLVILAITLPVTMIKGTVPCRRVSSQGNGVAARPLTVRPRTARACWVALGAVLTMLILYSALQVRQYYKLVPLATAPLAEFTVNGNPYEHYEDGLVENGNYINNYVCAEELASVWPQRSDKPLYSTTSNGFTVYPALLRYLNAIGTTKDSMGITKLSDADIVNIEKGIANPVYASHRPLKRMIYTMLYEYENYRHYNAVSGFTLLQRFELWRNAWGIFLDHPLFGTGTGDVMDECQARLAAADSPLVGHDYNIHNQYLAFLVTFGIVGTLLIVVSFIFGVWRHLKNPLFLANLLIILISFISENTLSTLAGCVFSISFLSIFATGSEHEPLID